MSGRFYIQVMSVSITFVPKVLLKRKKSKRHWILGFLLRQVNPLSSGCCTRQMSIRSRFSIIEFRILRAFLCVVLFPSLSKSKSRTKLKSPSKTNSSHSKEFKCIFQRNSDHHCLVHIYLVA